MNFLNEMTIPEGTVILLDNVFFHHSKVVKALAQQKKWFLLYTPPYSPWYNPIEGVFSIAKRAYYQGKNIEEAFECVTRSHFMKKSLFIHEMPQQKLEIKATMQLSQGRWIQMELRRPFTF